MMELADWHERLRVHFETLKSERGKRPVFSIEHGLDEVELGDLREATLESLSPWPPQWRLSHWLPWIVHATEIGYRYAGEEYWRTFERETPGWREWGVRNNIRTWFHRFHQDFNGFRPVGPWANHFNIICWPISHAVLPQDLQRQLAQLLYDLRNTFRPELLDSPELLGRHIGIHSWRFSKRFQDLAQEEGLMGQIAAALLQGEQGDRALILPDTLERIAKDLDQERQARAWLRGAQRAAHRTHQVGLRRGGRGLTQQREPRDLTQRPTSGPRFFLQQSQADSWSLWLETPDLSYLLGAPRFRDAMTRARVRVLGSRGTYPRGYLLGGTRRVRLDVWPSQNGPLVAFDPSSPELDFVVTTAFLAPPADLWVFRIQRDGTARHVTGKAVRPRERYVLISADQSAFSQASDLSMIQLECEGATACLLEVPDPLTRETEGILSTLGLTATRFLEAWPAGLPAAFWDGEGMYEWLSTDHPRIGFRLAHEIDAFSLRIVNNPTPPLQIELTNPGDPVFIELKDLEPGFYSLELTFKSAYPQFDDKTASLDILIRDPRPWEPGQGSQHPLLVLPDPPSPTLDELWDGRAALIIRGPSEHRVGCSMSLASSGGKTELGRKTGPMLQLPVDSRAWKRYFSTHFQNDTHINSIYDASRIAYIEIDGSELGRLSILCEKEFTAFKWIYLPGQDQDRLFLMNDTDGDVSQAVSFTFEEPTEPIGISIGNNSETLIRETGGLFAAQVGDRRVGIVAPPKNIRSLDEFHVHPRLTLVDRTPEALGQLLRLFGLWEEAHQTGNLVGRLRRRDVLHAILNNVFSVICGKEWARVEVTGLQSENPKTAVETMFSRVSKRAVDRNFMLELQRQLAAFPSLAPEERITMFGTAISRYVGGSQITAVLGEEATTWVAGFSLRLASGASAFNDWSKPNLATGLQVLLQIPILARAARFLVLGSHRIQQEQSSTWALYEGWEWE